MRNLLLVLIGLAAIAAIVIVAVSSRRRSGLSKTQLKRLVELENFVNHELPRTLISYSDVHPEMVTIVLSEITKFQMRGISGEKTDTSRPSNAGS